MVGEGRFQECAFEIWDGPWGHVGDGTLATG